MTVENEVDATRCDDTTTHTADDNVRDHLICLFSPPTLATSAGPRYDDDNDSNDENQSLKSELSLLLSSPGTKNPYHTPQSSIDTSTMMIGDEDDTPKTKTGSTYGAARILPRKHSRIPSAGMPVISESLSQPIFSSNSSHNSYQNRNNHNHNSNSNSNSNSNNNNNNSEPFNNKTRPVGIVLWSIESIIRSLKLPTTYIGSFIYLLYHVVFCLALGSAIMRPNNPVSMLGLMTKTAALGTLAASPVYWMRLNQDVPALYPTADLFLAPFLAKLALIVDQTLADDDSIMKKDNDIAFLVSFGVLTAIGTCMSSFLLLAASIFKLANLGSYLPFPVICGFFTAVGILTWTLAINVDTGGTSIATILKSGDIDMIRHFLLHHIPTLIVAGLMKYLGPKNPFFVCLVVVLTVGLFYLFMLVTGTSLGEMKEEGWFWSHEELVYEGNSSTLGFDSFTPPAPFGVVAAINHVHWGAVVNGLSTSIALSFLYLILCSVYVVLFTMRNENYDFSNIILCANRRLLEFYVTYRLFVYKCYFTGTELR
jgi:hypothetical protein